MGTVFNSRFCSVIPSWKLLEMRRLFGTIIGKIPPLLLLYCGEYVVFVLHRLHYLSCLYNLKLGGGLVCSSRFGKLITIRFGHGSIKGAGIIRCVELPPVSTSNMTFNFYLRFFHFISLLHFYCIFCSYFYSVVIFWRKVEWFISSQKKGIIISSTNS